jgi:hypothetical protein
LKSELWCCSLSHRYFCTVAVQHSHSGNIGLRNFLNFFLCMHQSKGLFYGLPLYIWNSTIIFIDYYFKCHLPPNSKRTYKLKLLLPRYSKTLQASNTQSPTPSESVPTSSSPTVCTAPSNTPDTHEGPAEEDGYHVPLIRYTIYSNDWSSLMARYALSGSGKIYWISKFITSSIFKLWKICLVNFFVLLIQGFSQEG